MSTTEDDLSKEKILKGGLTFLHSKAVWNLSTPDSLLWVGLTSVSEKPLTILEELSNENDQLKKKINEHEQTIQGLILMKKLRGFLKKVHFGLDIQKRCPIFHVSV